LFGFNLAAWGSGKDLNLL